MRSSSSRNVNGIGVTGNKKPTSALSKIGKHAPPPISPIISLKSTSSETSKSVGSGSGSGASKPVSTSSLSTTVDTATGTTVSNSSPSNNCAWRIPKVTESNIPTTTANSSTTTKYPQRKVPALAPEPVQHVKVEVEEKEKSFIERYEEFPDLKGKKPAVVSCTFDTSTPSANASLSISPVSIPLPPPPKLVGGDFNFLEDDDWLEGDNIDYSQNLFQDSEHFLASLPMITKQQPIIDVETPKDSCEVVKAKSLLAERSHSSKKKDIWKRASVAASVSGTCNNPCNSTLSTSTSNISTTTTTNVKIKILKRPEPVPLQEEPSIPVQVPASIPEHVPVKKKFTTNSKSSNNNTSNNNNNTSISAITVNTTANTTVNTSANTTDNTADIETKISAIKLDPIEGSKKKIVYSSASKTLQLK